jgi:4-hydroxymandelate oxidase
VSLRTLLPGSGAAPAGWGVRRAVRLAFPDPAPAAPDPARTERLRVYLTDLLEPYGVCLGTERPPDHGGHAYGDLGEALVRQAVPAGEQVDVLVLAYAVPDVTPGRATATWLSHVCPGSPLALAVSDQGPAAAFTALRLIHAYAATTALTRALLLVVEQPALPYPPLTTGGATAAPLLPDAAYGVALLLGAPAPGERAAALGTLRPGGATAGDLRAALGGDGTAVLGAGLDGRALRPGTPVRTASAGRPGTGVWWELAGALAEPPAGPRRLVLADRAPGSGGLALASVDLPAAAPRETAAAGAHV